jgi:hypothetical protein
LPSFPKKSGLREIRTGIEKEQDLIGFGGWGIPIRSCLPSRKSPDSRKSEREMKKNKTL